jgi:FlaA1/EpsC-like NDP-sugar epimerase
MSCIKIQDLAKAMISNLAPKYGYDPNEIDIVEIGVKPGEKNYEELMSLEETRRALELKNYFCVLPAFRNVYQDINYEYNDVISYKVANPYNSSEETSISVNSIVDLLEKCNLLDLY